ncbi:MAG: formyltransferase [Desulfuromonadales bacterium]|nr:formyltransferase [Desulfuromonadales bacterium]
MKLVICAYNNVGYACIEELLQQGGDIKLIFTHEDSLSEEIWFKSVRELALQHSIPFVTSSINLPENVEKLKEIAPDFIFSFYYRNMIKPEVLEIPKMGALNMHGSYLPKYRGRVPVNWAVINGETETGATLHYMVEKPDAGDIVDQEKVRIEFRDTAYDVFNKVTEAAVKVIRRSYPLLVAGKANRIPMDLKAGSYFGGRKPEDGLINWRKNAVEIYNLIRGVTHPYPGAFTFYNGKKVLIWKALPVTGKGEPGKAVSSNPYVIGTVDGLLEILDMEIEGLENSSILIDCFEV